MGKIIMKVYARNTGGGFAGYTIRGG